MCPPSTLPTKSHGSPSEVWCRRETLRLATATSLAPPAPDVAAARGNRPIVLHERDVAEGAAVTDEDGRALPLWEDTACKGRDHRLFWCACSAASTIHLYSMRLAASCGAEENPAGCLSLRRPEEVLPLADHFLDDAESILDRWDLRGEFQTRAASRVSLLRRADSGRVEAAADVGLGLRKPPGHALVLDTGAGCLALVRAPSERVEAGQRVHLRAYFCDDGEEKLATAHWLGLRSPLGSAAIGLALGIDGDYSVVGGTVPTGRSGEYDGWLRTGVGRRRGWRKFEIIMQGSSASFLVDNVTLVTMPTSGVSDDEEVWLVSRTGGCGVWAGVELFHTPAGAVVWDTQEVLPGGRAPWTACLAEGGRWQLDDDGVMRSVDFRAGVKVRIAERLQRLHDSFSRVGERYSYHPAMGSMLGNSYDVLAINDDGMVGIASPEPSGGLLWFPPLAQALLACEAPTKAPAEPPAEVPLPPALPEEAPPEVPNEVVVESWRDLLLLPDMPPQGEPPTIVGGLQIDCWSIPGERDLERMERVMTTFVQALQSAGVVMPENIRCLDQCASKQHPGCFQYVFGTRRALMATRMTGEGRLLLVVRCGGGFLDFVEFARRHGSLEQLSLLRERDIEVRYKQSHSRSLQLPPIAVGSPPKACDGARPGTSHGLARRASLGTLQPRRPGTSHGGLLRTASGGGLLQVTRVLRNGRSIILHKPHSR